MLDLSVLVLVLFQKNSPSGLRPVPPTRLKDPLNLQVVGLPTPNGPKMASKTARMVSKITTMVPKEPKMASRCFRDGPRCTPDGPRWTQDGLRQPKRPARGLQDGPRALQDVLQEGPNGPKSLTFLKFLTDVRILFFSALRLPKTAQELSKTSSRKARKGQNH